jgi:AraC-like DNA-binding protein
MLLSEKYKNDYAIHNKLNIGNEENNFYQSGYGCISRITDARGKKTFFNQDFYSVCYCIEGSSTYIDIETKKEYDIYPGCIVQRMPNTPHYTTLAPNSKWKEFYIQGSSELFEYLKKLNLVCTESVFYLGCDEAIHNKFIEYAVNYEKTELHRIYDIIPEFLKIIMYIHAQKLYNSKQSWADYISKIISENTNVGISMEEIALKCNMKYEALRKQFKSVFGYSIEKYRIQLRILEAKKMLASKDITIKEIAFKLGYYDSYAFSKQFKQIEGITPNAYRKSIF